ncbi:TIGR04283 family arsenosugar biosynthesis glycosyltransferase [Portibacter lacus]|uniref:Glycosyl hydrolase n=1 Tax=Portibacter lacus TaxID=1099794 RepID=A0AA37SR98_9BACT|nr:TIGR04283 family arsenosugar biosynthesis glycosyltransferase [Portibacter lacus]GLR18602.1 glycosyl hydrolase [Portibacter lacus]
MLSVIVPTFNEEQNICELISHIKSCDHGEDIEIIICDAPVSRDNGYKKALKYGVKAIRSPKAYRAFQMNYGADQATNEILYFLHADARPPKNFISEIIEATKESDFGIFAYKFNSDNLMLRMNSFFTRYDGLFAGGGDQSLFIKKHVFQELGKFNSNLRIMEDFEFYKRAKRSKLKSTIIKEPLVVSARKYEHNSWLKVNAINFSIFFLYWVNGSQERMIALNRKLN